MTRENLAGVREVTIREAADADVEAIAAIQNALIATETVEWRDMPHSVADRRRWLEGQREERLPVLVAVDDGGEVVGWSAFGPFRDWHKRPGYRLTVESTVHVREDWWGAGVGRQLVQALIDRATVMGMHVMVAAVDGDNAGSIRFHERLGFRPVARMPEVGTKFGRWLDLVLLQLVLQETDPPPGPSGLR